MQLVREENPVNAAFRVWPELTPTLLFDGGCDAVHTVSIYGAVSSSVNRSCSALFLSFFFFFRFTSLKKIYLFIYFFLFVVDFVIH